jgi:predicted DsbA family dithiol-disulfide isomerase
MTNRQLDDSKVKTVIEWHPFQLDPTLPTPGKDKMTHYRQKFGAERTASMVYSLQSLRHWLLIHSLSTEIVTSYATNRC